MSGGESQVKAWRLGETMGEAIVSTHDRYQEHKPIPDAVGFPVVTEAKIRIFEDGSGLFEFRRGKENISIRWTEEKKPLELFANFNGVEGELCPYGYDHTPNETTIEAMRNAERMARGKIK
jgi:hypothetical protein